MKDVIRYVSGPLLVLWFPQHWQKVPRADKCLINKIKKRFGGRLNPSPGFFGYWISRLIIFSGQTSIPPFLHLSFVAEKMHWSLPVWDWCRICFLHRWFCYTNNYDPIHLKATGDALSPFPALFHILLQDRNTRHCKEKGSRGWGMIHCLCKHEDRGSDLQYPHKCQVSVAVHL